MGASFVSGLVRGGVDQVNSDNDDDSKKGTGKLKKLKNKIFKPKSVAAAPKISSSGTSSDDYAGGFKRGGKIKGRKGKAVMIKAHAGERVLTEKQQRRMKRRMGGKRGAGRRR